MSRMASLPRTGATLDLADCAMQPDGRRLLGRQVEVRGAHRHRIAEKVIDVE